MGDIPPDFWVEVKYELHDDWDLLLKANTLFRIRDWKYFLLDRYKYNEKDDNSFLWEYTSGFDPYIIGQYKNDENDNKNYRSLPEDVSRIVNREKEARDWYNATYYTLKELEEIDLDEEMETPPIKDLKRGRTYKHALDFKIIHDGEEHDLPNRRFSGEKRAEALEKGGIDIEMFHRDGSYRFKPEYLIKQSEKKSDDIETPEPEEVTVTLKAEVRKKREHATDFEEFIDFLNELRTNKELSGNTTVREDGRDTFSKEEFRLVILYN